MYLHIITYLCIHNSFTEDQRAVYQGVLNAQTAVLATIKPGASVGTVVVVVE